MDSGGQRSVKDVLRERVGFYPKDAVGWLYAARGLYKGGEHHLVVQAVAHCLRNERTLKEAQHLLAFSLLKTGQTDLAAAAFSRSVSLGNSTDWQPLVELCCDNPGVSLGSG